MDRTASDGAIANPSSSAADGQSSLDINQMPDELLLSLISKVDPKSLMVTVPQVCKRWRRLCQQLKGVYLDFDWWEGGEVPVEALDNVCTLFPFTAKIRSNGVFKDMHLLKLIKCQGIVHADFSGSAGLTDCFVGIFLARCPLLTYVDFSGSSLLTDFVLIALAELCGELKHVDVNDCDEDGSSLNNPNPLTGASLTALAKGCPKLMHIDFDFNLDSLTAEHLELMANNCP